MYIRSNYRLYRKFFDHPIVYRMLSRIFGNVDIKVSTPENLILVVNPVYHIQLSSTKLMGKYEPEVKEALNKLLNRLVKDDMVFYDIGANVGVFSLFAISLMGSRGEVFAFEPEAHNLRCLHRTKEINGLEKLKIQEVCVAESSGEKTFNHRGGAFSGRLLDQREDARDAVVSLKPSISLDDFIFMQGNPSPDLIKIDVEGNKFRVLQGMSRTLEELSPVILCELHHNLCKNIPEIYSTLTSKGYIFYDLSEWILAKEIPLLSLSRIHHCIAMKMNQSSPLSTPSP